MLILSRKVGERVFVGNLGEICITVLKIQGGRVKIAIEADNSILINRAELAEQQQEGEEP